MDEFEDDVREAQQENAVEEEELDEESDEELDEESDEESDGEHQESEWAKKRVREAIALLQAGETFLE
jgi:hypothetical protein